MTTTDQVKKDLICAQKDPNRPNIPECYLGEKIQYVNARTKVIVTCLKHGDFEILPRDIVRRSYLCENCKSEHSDKEAALTKEKLKKKILNKYGDRFDFSELKFKNTQTKITLICKKHNHNFTVYPYDIGRREHLCEQCRSDALREKFSSNSLLFIQKAEKIHGKKYSYEKVNYLNANTKVTVTCLIHGDFEILPSAHLSHRGCKQCGIESRKQKLFS